MEIVTTLYPFVLVKEKSRRGLWTGASDNILIQTNHGPMLAAKIEKFQTDDGGRGVRTVLLTMEDIMPEPRM